jgi:hypothetical protein
MGYAWTHLAAATAAADPNRFLEVANGVMKNAAYTLTATLDMPEAGTARQLTLTHVTVAVGTDQLGTVTVVGKNLAGETLTEVITPVADSLVTGAKWFKSVTTVTGAGWTAVGGTDTIVLGCAATAIVAEATAGTLHGCQINTTAAGTITFADASGTIAVLPASVAVGTFYEWDAQFSGYLSVALVAASNITVLHSGSRPASYSKA